MSPDVHGRLLLGTRPRTVLAVLAATLALVAVLVASGILGGGSDDSAGTAAAATPTSSGEPEIPPTATPPPISPPPTGPTSDATALPPSQQPVPLEAATRVGEVGVSLVGIDAIQGTATGPGDVAGPALRVTVRLENGTADPLGLSGVTVTMTYGSEGVPASPLGDPTVAAFSGTLLPGGTIDGSYVFRVPADARNAVTVSVGYQPGAPYAVFTGAA